MKRHRILLVEDNTLFRQALLLMLAQLENIKVVGEVGKGVEAIEMHACLKPDLVLMDLSLPDLSGAQAIHRIKAQDPQTKVLVLTVHGTDENIFSAFSAGAEGYLVKDANSQEFFLAIESVLKGNMYVCPNVSRQVVNGYLAARRQTGPLPLLNMLTPREKEVLGLIARGKRNKEMSQLLELSTKTVEKHRSNIIKKLKLASAKSLPAFSRTAVVLLELNG